MAGPSFFRGWEGTIPLCSPGDGKHACLVIQSCPTLCNPWIIALQASLSMGFSRQEYWSGWPCPPPPGDLPNPGIKLRNPALQVDSLPSEPPGEPEVFGTAQMPATTEVPGVAQLYHKSFGNVIGLLCCPNKVPQAGWMKQQKYFSPTSEG